LRWAREHDCPWDSMTIAAAVRGGFSEIIQYVSDNGCPTEHMSEGDEDLEEVEVYDDGGDEGEDEE